ncbi:hypothetical protein CupriaWKF_27950 [Cupriavidus sp. WKF15]|uniref:hypothetical protein n=1 Tax=Cupriavidus sp. WKF15 TaxID=3032282 RepID=UPI0023E3178D|nr:hypothetical protein [Cupriavidus sp. WKF15]WER48607.1 hypothetical protein CupriaWKF_27950 [Cupriavidus sp. WKF15]
MSARVVEAALLTRCAAVAREAAPCARDPREANVRLVLVVLVDLADQLAQDTVLRRKQILSTSRGHCR